MTTSKPLPYCTRCQNNNGRRCGICDEADYTDGSGRRQHERIQQMYQYRNLHCTDLSWHIWGHDNLNKMSGVLEWCYDEADAKNRLAKMQSAGHFEDLEICQLAPDQILYRQFNHG